MIKQETWILKGEFWNGPVHSVELRDGKVIFLDKHGFEILQKLPPKAVKVAV